MADAIRSSVRIDAPPSVVFDYFTDPVRMVTWMGDYAVLDARVDGEFTVDINGVPVRGVYLEVSPPHRLVVSWGHAGSTLLPPGSSRVEVTLAEDGAGTRVEIAHHGLPPTELGAHAGGWPHFLERLRAVGEGRDPGPDPFAAHSR